MCDLAVCVREQFRRALGVVTITAVLSQVILNNMESLGVATITAVLSERKEVSRPNSS